jgi:hypothetical protein
MGPAGETLVEAPGRGRMPRRTWFRPGYLGGDRSRRRPRDAASAMIMATTPSVVAPGSLIR